MSAGLRDLNPIIFKTAYKHREFNICKRARAVFKNNFNDLLFTQTHIDTHTTKHLEYNDPSLG